MNLPIDFINRTKQLLGNDWEDFVSALNGPSPISIRLNKQKNIHISDNTLKSVPWYSNGFYLEKRPPFTFDPLFHAGCYYVQEASSMFIGHIIDKFKKENSKILDLCAAPGGKSTLITDIIDKTSLLVSNEVIRSRAHILAENMTKWGNPNVIVTNNDPAQIGKIKSFFDIILVDAPCSGEGMFRKDEAAISEWSVENVKLCKERQQRIIADIWPALKEDGILIYSTCTYNLEENEENVKWICEELGAENLSVDIEDSWNISPSMMKDISAYRFFPHKTKGEGFFCAILRKSASDTVIQTKQKKNKDNKPKNDLPSEYKDYLLNKDKFIFSLYNNNWIAIPQHISNEIQLLQERLTTLSASICMGEFKGKDFIPSPALALSNQLKMDSFSIYELSWHEAIAYLRKEALVLEGQPKGYILLTYDNKALGFVKNIGNRANNLYPQEWRIRSSNIPETEVHII